MYFAFKETRSENNESVPWLNFWILSAWLVAIIFVPNCVNFQKSLALDVVLLLYPPDLDLSINTCELFIWYNLVASPP